MIGKFAVIENLDILKGKPVDFRGPQGPSPRREVGRAVAPGAPAHTQARARCARTLSQLVELRAHAESVGCDSFVGVYAHTLAPPLHNLTRRRVERNTEILRAPVLVAGSGMPPGGGCFAWLRPSAAHQPTTSHSAATRLTYLKYKLAEEVGPDQESSPRLCAVPVRRCSRCVVPGVHAAALASRRAIGAARGFGLG